MFSLITTSLNGLNCCKCKVSDYLNTINRHLLLLTQTKKNIIKIYLYFLKNNLQIQWSGVESGWYGDSRGTPEKLFWSVQTRI